MAKVRSLKFVKQELERVEASLRKQAKGGAAAAAKKKLNKLSKLKAAVEQLCEEDPNTGEVFSPMSDASLAKYSAKGKKKRSKK